MLALYGAILAAMRPSMQVIVLGRDAKPPRPRTTFLIVSGSVTGCASSRERILSLSYRTTSRDRQLLGQSCMPEVRHIPLGHLGSFPRKVRASHMPKILYSQSAAMKSCCVDWANWTTPRRAQPGLEAQMLGGDLPTRKSLGY